MGLHTDRERGCQKNAGNSYLAKPCHMRRKKAILLDVAWQTWLTNQTKYPTACSCCTGASSVDPSSIFGTKIEDCGVE